jgi:septal ring factor EnvC (AmiA/AmiB activator)
MVNVFDPAFYSGPEAMVAGAVVAAVVLSFMLVIIIYAVRSKAQQEKLSAMSDLLVAKEEKIDFLEREIEDLKVVEKARSEEAARFEEIKKRYRNEKRKLEGIIEEAKDFVEKQQCKIAELSTRNRELTAENEALRESLDRIEEEMDSVLKRNEFWVEQIAELRTKYDALKMRAKNRER